MRKACQQRYDLLTIFKADSLLVRVLLAQTLTNLIVDTATAGLSTGSG
jgi:hypothetical protein